MTVTDELTDGITDQAVIEALEWTEYMPTLLGAIEAGYLDAHLKTLARACFTRRDVLHGTSSVRPDTDQPQTAPAVRTAPAATLGTVYAVAYMAGTFAYGTMRFPKSEVEGKVGTVPDHNGVMSQPWWGCQFKVLSVGQKYVSLKFLTWPPAGAIQPKVLKSLEQGIPIKVPIKVLVPYLNASI